MPSNRAATLLVLALVIGTASCSDSPTSLSDEVEIEGLEWSLALERNEVPSGGEFRASVTLHNTRADTVQFASTCSGLGHVHFQIYRDQERMSSWGGGCEHVIGAIRVAPDESWVYEATLEAVSLPENDPLDPGDYFVFADAGFGRSVLPVLARAFVVTEPDEDDDDDPGDDEPDEGS